MKAGTIPFKVLDGSIYICLVTSKKRKNKFVLPKGGIKRSESAADAAMRETYEEAGVEGSLAPKGLKVKAKSADPEKSINVIKYYPLEVKNVYEHWPEDKTRKRIWVKLQNLPISKMIKRDIKVLQSRRIMNGIKLFKEKAAA